MTRHTPRGLGEALRAAGMATRKPTEHDRPPLSTFPGRKSTLIPGQLTLRADEVGIDEGREPPAE